MEKKMRELRKDSVDVTCGMRETANLGGPIKVLSSRRPMSLILTCCHTPELSITGKHEIRDVSGQHQ